MRQETKIPFYPLCASLRLPPHCLRPLDEPIKSDQVENPHALPVVSTADTTSSVYNGSAATPSNLCQVPVKLLNKKLLDNDIIRYHSVIKYFNEEPKDHENRALSNDNSHDSYWDVCPKDKNLPGCGLPYSELSLSLEEKIICLKITKGTFWEVLKIRVILHQARSILLKTKALMIKNSKASPNFLIAAYSTEISQTDHNITLANKTGMIKRQRDDTHWPWMICLLTIRDCFYSQEYY